jgi:hypothetical protein
LINFIVTTAKDVRANPLVAVSAQQILPHPSTFLLADSDMAPIAIQFSVFEEFIYLLISHYTAKRRDKELNN